jgi:hypothetical protein
LRHMGNSWGGELCLYFKWTDVQEGLHIPAVLELELLGWLGLLEGSTFPATSCSFRQLRALRTIKMGQRDEALSASGFRNWLRTVLTTRGYRTTLIGGRGCTSYVCLVVQENPITFQASASVRLRTALTPRTCMRKRSPSPETSPLLSRANGIRSDLYVD